MFNSDITRLLGVKHPIIQGGMAWVAEAQLASAVSNAGGLGLIAGGGAPADVIRAEIRKAKTLTQKPFGLNIMLMSPFANDLAQLVLDEGVRVVTTGAGSPAKYMDAWKAAGVIVIPVIPSVALAMRMEKAGADAIVAEGGEAGGHIGELTTMCLVPQVVDAVSIPVIAAGGIADGRTLAAALMLGAQGVQVGTRFLVADECIIHENYKQMVLKARDTDSAVTGRNNGHPVRQIKNKYTRRVNVVEKEGADFETIENMTIGSLRCAVKDGDIDNGSFMAGQIAGLVRCKQPTAEIVKEMIEQAQQLIGKTSTLRGITIE